jgi:hypothetical protein
MQRNTDNKYKIIDIKLEIRIVFILVQEIVVSFKKIVCVTGTLQAP